jgi:hypothetical protein
MIDVEGLRAAITNAIDALAEVADQLPRPEPEEQFIAMAPADDLLPMVRTSVDVPLALHRQIKAECANNGEEISNAMRELIEICWPRRRELLVIDSEALRAAIAYVIDALNAGREPIGDPPPDPDDDDDDDDDE